MSKRSGTGRRKPEDRRQLSLEPLFIEVPPAPGGGDVASLDIGQAVREALGEILATACEPKSGGRMDRFAVAAAVSRLGGREVTKNMLDRYAAPGSDDWRFPLEALPALVMATGDFRLLDLLVEACGCKLLRGEEAWIAEFGAAMLHERSAKAHRQRLNSLIPIDVAERLTQEVMRRLGGGR